jgi:hypothetical protein
LCIEDVHALHVSKNIREIISTRMRWVGGVARMEEWGRIAGYKVLLKRPDGRLTHRW